MMKKTVAMIISAVMLAGCAWQGSGAKTSVQTRSVENMSTAEAPTAVRYLPNEMPQYGALNFGEQRAVWLTYMDMNGLLAEDADSFSENMSGALDLIAETGLNTVYLHVRAFADAYYPSELYPPAKSLPADSEGRPLYDPLKITVRLAHERGLSVHAWINPLRCETKADMERLQGYELYEWFAEPEVYPEYVSSPEGTPFYWLDPAVPEIREYIAAGVRELCAYDVDGLHIDDYFYPTTDPSFDSETYADSGTELPLAEWRMENCTEMVKLIHDTVKSADEEMLFGVSPQGNIGNNYEFMFADVKRWCAEDGFIDYIAPQLYFGYENTVCPFSETLAEWRALCTGENVALVCGLGLYKTEGDSAEEEFVSEQGIIARQIKDALSAGCEGFAVYSFGQLSAEKDTRSCIERECIMTMLTK